MKRLKTLKIEWRRPAGEVKPPVSKILTELCAELKKKNVDVIFIEKMAAGSSDEILFNDMPIEFLLDEARIKENFCGTCKTPAERKKISGKISEKLIKKAAYKAAGLNKGG